MSSLRLQERAYLCRFSFSDGRQCLTPRAPNHQHFCYFHAGKESRSTSTERLANDLSYFFSGEYLSANDLSAALSRVFPAVVRGEIKPRTARTLAYLAQTLIQTIHLAQNEYINALGAPAWRDAIRESIDQNFNHPSPTIPQNAATSVVANTEANPVVANL